MHPYSGGTSPDTVRPAQILAKSVLVFGLTALSRLHGLAQKLQNRFEATTAALRNRPDTGTMRGCF